jgi:hypothetical protein
VEYQLFIKENVMQEQQNGSVSSPSDTATSPEVTSAPSVDTSEAVTQPAKTLTRKEQLIAEKQQREAVAQYQREMNKPVKRSDFIKFGQQVDRVIDMRMRFLVDRGLFTQEEWEDFVTAEQEKFAAAQRVREEELAKAQAGTAPAQAETPAPATE